MDEVVLAPVRKSSLTDSSAPCPRPRPTSRFGRVTVWIAASVLLASCTDPPAEVPAGGPVPSSSSETVDSTRGPDGRHTGDRTDAVDRTDAAGRTDAAQPDEEVVSDPDEAGGATVSGVTVSETVATGLHTPWAVDFLPDGSPLVTLRDSGQVLRLDAGRTTTLDAGGPDGSVPDVTHEIEDGLLGVAVGPEGDVYLYLTTPSDNRVVRYDLEADALVNPTVILAGIPANETHSGGRLAFGPDGYLYVTTGDARELELPQEVDSLAGKILRITETGDPAPGNPFDNEVWSYGHRNVQGIGWTSDGRMYASEFGSSRFDELNLIEPGSNYGWPHVEGWAGDPRYADPLVTWSTDDASPSGIAVTDDGVWLSALKGERLWHVPLDASGTPGTPVDYDLGLGRLRTVVKAPDGDLWVVTSNTDGRGRPADLDDRVLALEITFG